MRALFAVGDRFVLAVLWSLAGCAAMAQTSIPAPALVQPGEALPTRFGMCQREVRHMQGDRKQLMRRCLTRRLEGERIVERDCRRQAGQAGAARQQAQRDCVRQALAMRSDELPKRPPPPPVAPAAAVDQVTSTVKSASSRLPAAGEN